jgi:hypothetical protein
MAAFGITPLIVANFVEEAPDETSDWFALKALKP